jgi:hypothetical protein
MQLVAATAVFLGGKMAENARRLLDVVGHYYALKNKTPNLPPEKSKGACVPACLHACMRARLAGAIDRCAPGLLSRVRINCLTALPTSTKPPQTQHPPPPHTHLPKVVQDLKEEVLAYERLMLHVLGFNLYMDLPDYVGTMKKVKGPWVPSTYPYCLHFTYLAFPIFSSSLFYTFVSVYSLTCPSVPYCVTSAPSTRQPIHA